MTSGTEAGWWQSSLGQGCAFASWWPGFLTIRHSDRSKQYERVPWLGNVLQLSQAIGHKTAFLSVRDWASFVP
jgi:hypothetical protein